METLCVVLPPLESSPSVREIPRLLCILELLSRVPMLSAGPPIASPRWFTSGWMTMAGCRPPRFRSAARFLG
jgi:hypothetical protein